MKPREELELIVKLIKKYNLPLSPILEYAIKEEMAQLSSDDESPIVKPVVEVQKNDGMLEVYVKPTARTRKEPSVLRIVRADGTVIECEKSATAFCQAIKEVGAEKVYSLKIPKAGMYLVTIGRNPRQPSAQYDIGNGYFVNVHSNNITKKRQLERIFRSLNINWKVEIVE